jgi:hypothetical protein
MSGYKDIGKQFVDQFYNNFNSNVKTSYQFYNDNAYLTFNDNEYGGVNAIKNLYNSFGAIQHFITNINYQPIDNNILIIAKGYIIKSKTFNSKKEIHEYHETIVLSMMSGNWEIINHIFTSN